MAGMGKVKALQVWCKNRLIGYQNVEIKDMTTSWRDGLAFCALIHKFRPDLIDFESLSKENVFENNALAFAVAESLGVAALLDAEDMVRLETPDKLSIITYVAQLHNYFKDKEPVGGPDVKVPTKRPSNISSFKPMITSPESKKKPLPAENNNRDSVDDVCSICDGKVYLIEKHVVDGKIYHRSCFKRNNRKSDTSLLLSSSSHSPAERITPLKPADQKLTPRLKPAEPSHKSDTDLKNNMSHRPIVSKRFSAIIDHTTSEHRQLEPVSENTTSEHRQLEPVSENTVDEKDENSVQKIQLRSKPPVTTHKAETPRAVSSGITLEDKIGKLRELKLANKGKEGSPVLKARLEMLQAKINKDKNGTQNQGFSMTNNQPANALKKPDVCDHAPTLDVDVHSEKASKTQDPENKPKVSLADVVSATVEILNSSIKINNVDKIDSNTEPIEQHTEHHAGTVVSGNNITENQQSELRAGATAPASANFEDARKEILDSNNSLEALNRDKELSSPVALDLPSKSESPVLLTSTAVEDKTLHQKYFPDDDSTLAPALKTENNSENFKTLQTEPSKSLVIDNIQEPPPVKIVQQIKTPGDNMQQKAPDAGDVQQSKAVSSKQQDSSVGDHVPLNQSPFTESAPLETPAQNTSVALMTLADSPAVPARAKRNSSIRTIRNTNTASAENLHEPVKDELKPAVINPARTATPVSINVSASPSGISCSNTSMNNDASKKQSLSITESSSEILCSSLPSNSASQESDPDAASQSSKPKRPDRSPVVHHRELAEKTPPPRPTELPEQTRTKSKPAPKRPVTMAEGYSPTAAGSNGFGGHIKDGPPKPARLSLAKEPSEYKRSKDTENSSKEKNKTVWYAAVDYPEEINPFGEDDETKEENIPNKANPQSSERSPNVNKAEYRKSLNPFSEDEEVSRPCDSNKLKEKPGIIKTNPFESDDELKEDHEAHHRKKLVPDQNLRISPETPKNNKKASPDAHVKHSPKSKKKNAPTPPSLLPQAPKVTELQSNGLKGTHSLHNVNETTPVKSNESQNVQEEKCLNDSQRRKSKPAPPRPMPPKRREMSDFGLSMDEMQTELESIEKKQLELESKGRELESAIRNSSVSQEPNSIADDDLLANWLETVNEKNHLLRRETELVFMAKQLDLEAQQADLEWDLRVLLNQAENLKSDADKAKEEELLSRLVSIVQQRSKLVDRMDEEKLRQQEEDSEIQLVLGQKFHKSDPSAIKPNSKNKKVKEGKTSKAKK